MTSIVIAAHNEANVLGRCLDSFLSDAAPDEFDVTVVANGCTDNTADVAASRAGVRVIEIGEASKPAALNSGDKAAVGFPRIYLDADILVSTAGVRALSAAVTAAGPLAAVPRRELEVRGRPAAVRAYFAINARLPVFREGLFGRGMICLSETGRARYARFPDMVADDLFLDSLFTSREKCLVDEVVTVVATPLRTRDLVRRLARVRRGNAAMREAARAGEITADVRASRPMSWLRDVVAPRPWLAPAAVVYVGVTALAAAAARRAPAGEGTWERDDSTRQATPQSFGGDGS